VRGSARAHLLAGLLTVALTAGTMAALAATVPAGAGASPYWMPMLGWRDAGCRVPVNVPGQRVPVLLADMGAFMAGPMMGGRSMVLSTGVRTVPAGRVTLVGANRGTRAHELVVLPLPSGQPVGARAVAADDTVDERGSLGEASRSCAAGEGPGIAAGATGWVTLDLRPGRYELVCNRPGHYRAGMATELDVR
jgi:uncharacterized cupredoxin-like copper-binding protein